MIKKRLEGLLHFMDVSAPDLHNRFEPLVKEAETEAELEALERRMLEALKPRGGREEPC